MQAVECYVTLARRKVVGIWRVTSSNWLPDDRRGKCRDHKMEKKAAECKRRGNSYLKKVIRLRTSA
eukprot:411886-Pelagomonas_calceolata.AAC.1